MKTSTQKTVLTLVLLASFAGACAYFASRQAKDTPSLTFPSIPSLTQEKEIETLQRKHDVLLIFVHMKRCGPCERLSPKINQLASENQDPNTHFVKIDRDDAKGLCEQHDIKKFPTVLIFHKGKLVKQFEGCSQMPVSFFAEQIQALR